VPELVALDLEAGAGFVDALVAAWEGGHAVLPLDPRLPPPARRQVVAALRPSRVVDASGSHRLDGGRPVEPGDALVVATSGTTGAPKGVVLTGEAVRASSLASSAALGVDPGADRWVACLPLAHVGGLSVVTRALDTGTPVTVLPRFDPDRVEAEARAGATLVSLVATALARTDTSGYRAVLLGGAAPPAELPAHVVTTYGMTETGSGVVYDGRPLDGVEIRIDGGQRGPSVPDPTVPGPADGAAVGEILVRGPMLLRAYRDGTDPKRPGGWFPTGDGGLLGPDGNLEVVGRLAEVVVTGAEKVWPAPVERILATAPGVAEVAVWKRPDPEWGERVVAWVVPTDPDRPPVLGDLRELVASSLAPWAAPRELVVVDALPRTPSGKVRRTALG
jgi:O-succinylbenzoic acid--CoA ligase